MLNAWLEANDFTLLLSVIIIYLVFLCNTNLSFQVGFQAIAEALGLAAVKAVVALSAIIAGGRLVSDFYNWGVHVQFVISKIYSRSG